MRRRPYLAFVVALVLVGPLLAMVGTSIGGVWSPAGVGAGAVVVAVAASRSAIYSYRDRELHPLLRWRMMAVHGIVAATATMLVGGSLVILVLELIE